MEAPERSLQVTARGECEIVITRSFRAPRELVFRALTEAELLSRWLTGPEGWSTSECTSDPRRGGAYRHAWVHADGQSMALWGVYREVEAPARIVRTESFEFGCDAQAPEHLSTLTLESHGERTDVCMVVAYANREERDAALASGMEQGMDDSYRSLDGVLGAAAD